MAKIQKITNFVTTLQFALQFVKKNLPIPQRDSGYVTKLR